MGHRIDIGHMGKRQGDGEQTRGAGHRDCLSVHTEHPVKTKNRRVRGIRLYQYHQVVCVEMFTLRKILSSYQEIKTKVGFLIKCKQTKRFKCFAVELNHQAQMKGGTVIS